MEENKNSENQTNESPKGFFSQFANKRTLIYVAFTIMGIVAGFLYYRLVGCNRGCTITSSPYLSMLWGGMIGFLLPGVFEKPKKK
jgi:hypothetical protein